MASLLGSSKDYVSAPASVLLTAEEAKLSVGLNTYCSSVNVGFG